MIGTSAGGPQQAAVADDELVGHVTEREHRIEVTPGPELTTLEVSRTFLNPTFDPQQLSLKIGIPCDAIVDELWLRGPDDRQGRPTWVACSLLDPEVATGRFDDDRFGASGTVVDADTIAVLSRPSHRQCAADLDVFPIPALRERSVRYRVQVPTVYVDGRYQTELPSFVLERTGARLTIDAAVESGFDVAIDGRPLDSAREFDGRDPHTVVLTPRDGSRARTSLAAIDLQALGATDKPSSVVAAELDLPTQLVDLPAVRRVAVVVDGSHSLGSADRASMQALASAYLEALEVAHPPAGVEVVVFDRHARAVHGEFVSAGRARESLAAEFASRNGSEPGVGLALARELLVDARQPGEPGVDWIVLLSDLELREGYPMSADRDAALAGDIRLHVISPGANELALTPRPRDEPWMAMAQAVGGAHFGYVFDEESLARDGSELLTPNRVWDLTVVHGREVLGLAAELRAGQQIRWLDKLAGPPPERVFFEAFSWAMPMTWSVKSSSQADQRWAGRLTTGGDPPLDLDDSESRALAQLAKVASPWTSLLAEARFAGPSLPAELWGCGGGWFGSSHGCGFSCGAHRSVAPRVAFDLSVLQGAIDEALGACPGLDAASLEFEILDREIAAVRSSNACAREAIWTLDLRGWPGFGHPIVQVAFDGTGVRHLESTPLDGEAPASGR